MSTFTPLHIEAYRKTNIPQGVESQREFLDQQLRRLERTTAHLRSAVEQLQAEMDLIWDALNNLGETRP